jgi:hypothetical protein
MGHPVEPGDDGRGVQARSQFVVVAGLDPATHSVTHRRGEGPMQWVARSSRVTTHEGRSRPCLPSFVPFRLDKARIRCNGSPDRAG